MMLVAWSEGIGSCPNGIADAERLGPALDLEAEEQVATVLTFGYPRRARDPERRTPEEWIERANRLPFDDVVEWL
jgi:nitroreductase